MMIASEVVDRLKTYVDFVTVCPEVEIGLGVPRKPIRLISVGGEVRLKQFETAADMTDKMKNFAASFLEGLDHVDGFILKGRSPSCGIKDVKLYPDLGKVAALKGKGEGIFGAEVLKRFSHLAVEDEGRLTNFTIREHFLTKLYSLARLKILMKDPTMKSLVDFHARNKFLLMSYSQAKLRELGRVVANHEKKHMADVVAGYSRGFIEAFSRQPRYTTNVNVLTHALGHFSDSLNKDEKAFFMESLDKYQRRKLPLSVPLSIIRSYIARFGEEYLANQTYFNPYPEDLVDIRDSGAGRDY